VKNKVVLGVVIQRTEEGHALNMVPVEVSDKDMGKHGLVTTLVREGMA
jgi:hypothetical protein